MRSSSALYIDAGYLLAAAATRQTGSSLRTAVAVDYGQLVTDLIALVESRSGLPLLRVYWYDAAREGKATPTQEQIAVLPRVKLRLGRIGVDGEQKGVDLRIGLDLVGHSRNAAIDTMYLLSGDDDLTEAVEEAQAQGVRVVVLGVPGRNGQAQGMSRHLLFAADDLELVEADALDTAVTVPTRRTQTLAAPSRLTSTFAETVTGDAPTPADIARVVAAHREEPTTEVLDLQTAAPAIHAAAQRTWAAWNQAASDEQRDELKAGRPSIPRDLDRALLVDASAALGVPTLSDPIRVRLRAGFWAAYDDAP